MRLASACIFLFLLLGVTLGQTVTIAEYICQRLRQVGTDTVFGVTGDYSYLFLHAVDEPNSGLKRVGNNNELEAAYAAWAYAHVSPVRAPGAVSVTYGPGSYPTISALGGASRENVPVIVISGAASTTNWQYYDSWGAETHHMVEGAFTTQRDAFRPVTVAQEVVTNTASAAAQIDAVILAALIYNKPVYLEVWVDLWTATIPAPVGTLSRVGLPTPVATIQSNVDAAVAFTLAQLQASHFPIIFVSLEIKIYNVQALFQQLISLANIPYYTNYAAKGILSEPNTWYTGILGTGNSKEYMADFLLEVGTTYDDNSHTTASYAPNARSYVRARRGKVDTSARNLYPNVPLEPFLEGLIAAITASGYYNHNYTSALAMTYATPTADAPTANLTYASFVNHLRYAGFLNEDSVLIVDTTIIMYYIQKTVPIRQDGYLGDAFWLAIGWSGGAAVGAKAALPNKKMLVVVGDGGFQNCPTGLGTSVAQGHDTVVFILHNNVYAIEQHEEDPAPYSNSSAPFYPDNLIQDWNYAQFGAAVGAHSFRTYTHADLTLALASAASYTGTTVVEIMLGKFDIPPQGNIAPPPATTAAASTATTAAATTATTASSTTAKGTTSTSHGATTHTGSTSQHSTTHHSTTHEPWRK
jgi:indolepyruvate decarboxylase